ncbi:radical SAM protein [Paenibacillus silvae]|uniref:radical SAM protein n=1 Tax=Paenibacillus silvae TaxID=1325358 RepID=UPI0020051EA4|nr:radical SAM protein [Paenibacillus silvae]MCK6076581.1 radical SAM protein [Paenibacillus silvae]MCK6151008.1 radical SAM protein [Paenibacillus silvae]MCK6269268.1 radical SAM protein [Paenibacillus silvae]
MKFDYLKNVNSSQVKLLKNHLLNRLKERDKKSGLSIVYDLTYMCNQACPGCCVSAIAYKKGTDPAYLTMKQHGADFIGVQNVLKKIKTYVDQRPGLDIFIDFGGGELTLRPDWKDIVKLASKMFGVGAIGLNTNGTRVGINEIKEIEPYTSYIGISIDGLEKNHNEWRKTVEGGNAFQRTITLVKKMIQDPTLAEKLDITTVPTQKNIHEIPDLMRYLKTIGVKNYSVHRAMQVGRFWSKDQLLPTKEQYFELLVNIVEINEELGMKVHLHHSIESIYGALLLGYNTYAGENLGNPDQKSSLGIDPMSRIFFDPWCTVSPWDKLAKSPLLDEDMTFESALNEHDGVQDIIDTYCRKEVRCQGCAVACSGGNRIASAANHIRSNYQTRAGDVQREDLLQAMNSVDPACPLYIDSRTFDTIDSEEFQSVVKHYSNPILI